MKLLYPFKPLAAMTVLVSSMLALSGCAGDRSAPDGGNPQVLLLGEVHDNADGHKRRYEHLRQRVEAGWRPAIAMEQFDREQQPLLNKAQKDCRDAQCVILVMHAPRWDWPQYKPIIDLALRYQLPLVAANLSRADASKVVRDGVASSFDADTIAAYQLRAALPADIVQGQRQEIVAGHCGMLPDEMVPGMVHAQMARDIWMAKLVRAQQPRDVVLIAGNGHVRKDVGVPRWLAAITPRLTVRSIGYVEQAPARGEYDSHVIIAGKQRADACAGLKAKS
ncbi:MAG: ChaN family lipoprotein [Burkholderiaceae bacterium]|nr:ChaN family lipoprotein [Burkholderiaceae bacterium]